MKKVLTLMLTATALSASAQTPTPQDFSQAFKNYRACFILYSVTSQKIVSEYNPHNRCSQRISPDSTFKVALSLMAFNQGVITQKTIFKWDGQKSGMPGWDQNQTPATWLKYSVVWVSQQITPQLGYDRIEHYLAGFNYGNQDFSGDPGQNNGLTHAWLASSLQISAIEQLNFLKAMLGNELPVNHDAVTNTEKNMYLGKLDNGADYYGKTGSGRHGRNERETNPSHLRDGSFIGFINNGTQQYIFVSNLTDKYPVPADSSGSLTPYGSQILKPITLQLLNEYFAK